jgi:nanoRNase/pAp phosphatase (c-di-AMP/oligoRNAs hydrolase)
MTELSKENMEQPETKDTLDRKVKNQDNKTLKTLNELDRVMRGKAHLLIVIHNNPDPDSIASAAALAYLAEKRHSLKASIAFGGIIGRAENREMVSKLKIQMKQINRINFKKYDCIALIDTQPGVGNNSLPPDMKCHIVIDHHPKRKKLRADFAVIEPDIGATSTILIDWLKSDSIDIPTDLATGLAYAIISETQNLGRETTKRDIEAYLSVYIQSNIRKLAQITVPRLKNNYFRALATTLNRAIIYRNLICAHIGDVPTPEIVSEMANFLLRHERISWSLCSGRFKDRLILSIRASNPESQANELVKSLVPDPNTAGGHEMSAGGYIALNNGDKQELMEREIKLSREFAAQLGYDKADWKPLLSEP